MSIRPQTNRIHSIDALRGFAIFGIFVVNIFVFHVAYAHYGPFYFSLEGVQMQVTQWMFFLFAGKFMFIFAFLFGYGCWMQYEKYDSRAAFQQFWWRRMLILAGIGIMHIVFLSMGDILFAYAVLGLTLPFFVSRNDRTLIIFFLLIYLIPVYEFLLRPYFDLDVGIQSKYSMEEYIEMNLHGNFWELIKLRVYDYFSFRNEKLIMYIPKEMSLFLLGIFAARHNWAIQFPRKKALAICLFGVVLALVMLFFRSQILGLLDIENNFVHRVIAAILIQSSEFFHGLAYILGFWLLWSWKPFSKLLFVFTYVGKLSLTNYLLQSLIAFFLFTGYGFGWYAQLQPTQLLLLAVGIFALQVLFSYLWLRKFKFGPIEKLWRKWSYR